MPAMLDSGGLVKTSLAVCNSRECAGNHRRGVVLAHMSGAPQTLSPRPIQHDAAGPPREFCAHTPRAKPIAFIAIFCMYEIERNRALSGHPPNSRRGRLRRLNAWARYRVSRAQAWTAKPAP
jgi:hypothetical protein